MSNMKDGVVNKVDKLKALMKNAENGNLSDQ